jgi:hypothetical protein
MIMNRRGMPRFFANKGWRALGLAALSLLLAACPLADDPLEGSGGLDPRLYGVWRFDFSGNYEEIQITRNPRNPANAGAFIYGGNIHEYLGYRVNFAGDIVYAENFSESAGVIIIEYWPEYKQVWINWDASEWPYDLVPRNPQPEGNFYGIYFLNMNEEGTQVFLACTNDQSNNYGPTETLTLEQAVTKFDQGNLNQMLDLSVGDPQHKVQDL